MLSEEELTDGDIVVNILPVSFRICNLITLLPAGDEDGIETKISVADNRNKVPRL